MVILNLILVKANVSLCLIKHYKDVWRREGIAPPFLTSAPDEDE
jgi:hypothetical protein